MHAVIHETQIGSDGKACKVEELARFVQEDDAESLVWKLNDEIDMTRTAKNYGRAPNGLWLSKIWRGVPSERWTVRPVS